MQSARNSDLSRAVLPLRLLSTTAASAGILIPVLSIPIIRASAMNFKCEYINHINILQK